MENQLTNNANALRLFFNDDVFLVKDENVENIHLAAREAISDQNIDVEISHPQTDLPQKDASISALETKENVKSYVAEAEIPRVVTEPEVSQSFKYLGGNKKSVLILVNDQLNDVSTESGRDLLRKIVKAVDLNTPDFAVLNYAHYPGVDFAALQQFFKPVIMLSFGVEISALKLNLTWQNEIIFHQETKIIFAPNLHHLDSDITAKKLLWGNLQKIK